MPSTCDASDSTARVDTATAKPLLSAIHVDSSVGRAVAYNGHTAIHAPSATPAHTYMKDPSSSSASSSAGASNAHEKTPLVLSTFATGDDLELGKHTSHAPPSPSRPRPPLSPLRRAPTWQFWAATAASHRFYLLLLMSCIPFGGHFVKNGMSALEPLMLQDADFPLTNTMYGALVSAVSVPNMFIPLFGGRLLDKSGHRSIKFFLVWICVGQAIFAIGMELRLFWLALFGRVFFGVGEGSVVVGARVFIAYWFRDKELTFAMGVAVAVTNVSKMVAKSTVAPIALYFGGYVQALWYGVVVCVASVVVGFVVCKYTSRLQRLVKDRVRDDEPLDEGLGWLKEYADGTRREAMSTAMADRKQASCGSVRGFSSVFWIVAILHVVFISVFHLFQNVSSSFLSERYGYSVVKSGVVSAASHSFVVFAPLIGLLIDKCGGHTYWIVTSALLSILAYGLMIFTEVTPVVSMLLISICLSFTPTILVAAVPRTVGRDRFGAAFGIVGVTNAVGASFGNVLIGYLRDQTGSYDAGMFMLWGMAIMTFVLSLALVLQDKRHGGVLSAPSSRRQRTLSVDDDEPIEPMQEGSPQRGDRRQRPPTQRPGGVASTYQSTGTTA